MTNRGNGSGQAPEELAPVSKKTQAASPMETLEGDSLPPSSFPRPILEADQTLPDHTPFSTEKTLDAKTALGIADTMGGPDSFQPPVSHPPLSDAPTLSLHAPSGEGMPLGLIESNLESEPHTPIELPPTLKERFEEVSFLGQGGMGAVYRAKDKRLGRDVAIKLLYGGGAEITTQMLREARSQARLEHENACKVYEVGVAEGHRYILMQLIHGEPLDKAKARMTLEQKIDVIRRVGLALHEAHRMGLVHRDVKPSNIMVEQTEDGVYKPFLMDFGLAREVGNDHTATRSGVIAGTPAFMSPEQALGRVRSLDRRTDVYSLGATLYDLLCDRPPFVDESVFRLLQRLTKEDVTPLSKVAPEIPRDIDAITMKCLEKEPIRRYDSAKALSDDLQRFLDGEPVTARHASLSYVAVKKLRRHKGKAALLGAALVTALILIFAWIREQRLSAQREVLARELGENIKEMELLMRQAYSLPLHNIEREKAMVRTELGHIEERMSTAGPAAEGPGHYALGRGYAVLEEREKALEHLEKARAAGYAPPELDYAMGLILGELYQKALEETKRIENPEKKKAKIEAVEAEFKVPSLAHLRAALGAKLEAPAYVEGLIALYEGRNEEAMTRAKEAYSKIPWLYEAKKLEGDAYFAEGSKYRHDAAFDYEKMSKLFEQASRAYEESSSIARSNASVYEASCELWIQTMLASHVKPELLKPSFEHVKSACESALQADANIGTARTKMAYAFVGYTWQMMTWQPGAQEIAQLLEQAAIRGNEAARLSPTDPMAHYVAAAAWRNKALHLSDRGFDATEALESAIAAYQESIKLDPNFLWAYNELCATYALRARHEVRRGKDPSVSIENAIARCRKCNELEPTFLYAYINQAMAYNQLMEYLNYKGRSPNQPLQAALSALKSATTQSPNSPGPLNITTLTYLLRATYEDMAEQDTNTSIELIEKNIGELRKISPDGQVTRKFTGTLALLKATRLARQKRDPEPFLNQAITLFELASKESPWDVAYLILRARAGILGLRWALHEKKANENMFVEASGLLSPLLDQDRVVPDIYQALAEIHFLKASWLASNHQPFNNELDHGLAMIDKALAVNPGMALAFQTQGNLWLLRAQQARDPKTRTDAATQAKKAFNAALRENPLLKRDIAPLLEELQKP